MGRPISVLAFNWLCDGKQYYGDGLYQQAALAMEKEEGTLRNQKALSDCFELSGRSDNLSWEHHYRVSSLKQIQEDDDGKLFLSNEPDHAAGQHAAGRAWSSARCRALSCKPFAWANAFYVTRTILQLARDLKNKTVFTVLSLSTFLTYRNSSRNNAIERKGLQDTT